MDEPSNQDEICSNIFEQNYDAAVDENGHICQFGITVQTIEESETNTLTTEALSLVEPNMENTTVITDESEDEPLLSIPPLPNNRQICSHYWLEILGGSIIVIFVVMVITAGILFTRDSILSSVPTKGCNKQSDTGKSCSIDNLKTIVLISLSYSSYNKNPNYSLVYTAVSDRTIITFSFEKGSNMYLDDVSIRDTSNNVELIEDGGFESGTLYAYCVCDSTFKLTKPTKSHDRSGSYVCDVNNFFSPVQLSQSVKTIAGREYNVSFWLQSQSGWDNTVTVYMSSAFKISEPHFISLLLTKFIIIFFVSCII